MGCDGGTIPRRDELVRLKKKPEQKDKEAELAFKWKNCAISQQPLQEPIVACGLGKLYSKSSILEALLDKANKPESVNHIRNLKDVKDLNLSKNPAYVNSDRTDATVDDRSAPYICPIIGLEMSGNFRFVYIWSCGCVFSERALKEIKQNICHKCQQPFTDEDVVILNGNEADVNFMKTKMDERNSKRKSSKKQSKASTSGIEVKAAASASTTKVPESASASTDKVPEVASASSAKTEESPGTSSDKVKEEIPVLGLPKPQIINGNTYVARAHFGSSKRAHNNEMLQDPSYKKTKNAYSVAKDPKSSEVYKSLFTSHHTDKEQNRAHWVTYNPHYN